jgi:hypothetical protein
VVVVVVLFLPYVVVVRLALTPARTPRFDARVDDNVVVTALVVAEIVLAPAPEHNIPRVVPVLATIVVVDRPDAVVPIYVRRGERAKIEGRKKDIAH